MFILLLDESICLFLLHLFGKTVMCTDRLCKVYKYRDAGAVVGSEQESKGAYDGRQAKPAAKLGVWGAFTGNLLVPRTLDCLKIILRMFQITETMFF